MSVLIVFQVATEQNKVTKFYCEPCGKKLSSEAAYNNHLSSAKHKACVVKLEQRISESEGTPQVSEEKAVKSDTSKKQLGTNGNDKMDTGMCLISSILFQLFKASCQIS